MMMACMSSAQSSPVELRHQPEVGHHLLVDGHPFFIRGAGAYGKLEELKAAGANAARIWNSRDYDWINIADYLHQAHALGLKIMLGLELPTAKAFDYRNESALEQLIAEYRTTVRERRDHPALLLWGIGNEIEWGRSERDEMIPVWRALNRIARMVKEEDPYHPTVIVLAGDAEWKIEAVERYCPDIDILGLNVYHTLSVVPEKLERLKVTKPYLITEYGPRGWWEQERTPWRAILEPTSHEKAAEYVAGYRAGIDDQPNCLGSFAFIWGAKEEATLTYFGSHLPSGEPTAIVDALTQLWSGRLPADRAPRITRFKSSARAARLAPGTIVEVAAKVGGEGPFTYEWRLTTDGSAATTSGLASGIRKSRLWKTWADGQPVIKFEVPKQAGSYRLYLFVRDRVGKGASANFPFRS